MQLIVTDPTIKLCVELNHTLSQKDTAIMYIAIKGKKARRKRIFVYLR